MICTLSLESQDKVYLRRVNTNSLTVILIVKETFFL